MFRKRTSALILSTVSGAAVLAMLGLVGVFWLALALVVIWGLIFSAEMPIRQAYLNDMIPSKQRATVLSFDSLMGNSGGVVIQPVLGRTADISGYATSFLLGSLIQLVAVPFIVASRRQNAAADSAINGSPTPTTG